jgi:hypothetical protein
MTLGPAVLALPLLERFRGPAAAFVSTLGRVPLFFYVLHVPLISVSAAIYFSLAWNTDRWHAPMMQPPPPGFTPSLPLVYTVTAITVATLYFPCRWYMRLKQREQAWWLSYL